VKCVKGSIVARMNRCVVRNATGTDPASWVCFTAAWCLKLSVQLGSLHCLPGLTVVAGCQSSMVSSLA